jgi:hypothetical protein
MNNLGDDRFQGKGDEFYAALMAAHTDLGFFEGVRFNLRLVLILANLVGDPAVLQAAIAKAAERPDHD